ncbi:TonB-dependent receptor [Emcibacter sp.]|uniref:TonB-dependent receptor n=1 Tax=Emcibacter sp. TaxID=1979954 RepID=UPI002AA6E8F4|nr:TonB-dependent receptor [Emcibacter sp.]
MTRKNSVKSLLLTTALSMATLGSVASAADFTGTVLEGSERYALEGAMVEIKSEGLKTTTDTDGRFRFRGLAAGTYEVSISYVGTAPVTRTITVGEENVSQMFIFGQDDLEEIVVTGFRGSMNSSLNKQRAADNIANYLSADAAGNFPDQNIAEAARRLVGLSMESDQGEGRFVIVRGIDPNLNSTTINGTSLPSPEGDERKVALDVIPSELLETLQVTKSATPDMDGDFIGGNIEVKTISGFDKDERLIKLKAEGSYNKLQDKLSPKVSAVYADQLSEKLAVAASVSWQERKHGADNKEVDGGWKNSDDDDNEISDLYPAEMELRDYSVTRERFGAALNIDFRPTDNTNLYLRSLYSRFKDSELRQRTEIKYEDGVFADGVTGGPLVYIDEAKADRDLKDRIETQKIFSTVLGGESFVNDWTFEYSVSYSHSEEREPDRLDTDFKSDERVNVGVDISDPLLPVSIFASDDDLALFTNAGNYEMDAIEYSDNITEDDEWAFKLDVRRDMDFGGNQGYIKFGGKYKMRDKMRDNTFVVYEDLGDYTLADFATTTGYGIDDAQGGLAADSQAIRDFFRDNIDSFSINEDDTILGSEALDYTANEDILAGYLMGSVDVGNLRIVAGLRVEHTEFDAIANQVIVGDESSVTEVVGENSYTDWLPSVNMRYDLGDSNAVIRAAYYKAVVRPKIGDMVPSGEIEAEDDDGEIIREGSLGNPSLNPYRAHNFDLGVEWYPNNDSIVSAGAFYKKIKNFHFDQIFEDITVNGIDFAEVSQPQNGEDADIFGIELNFQQNLTMLPAPFDGLIVGANYTYTDSEGSYANADGELVDIPLPKTSEHVANAIIGYEKGGFSIRAALSYRSEYLDEVNEGDGDRYVLGRTLLDVTASYEVTRNFKIYTEVSNLTNEKWNAVYRTADGDYLMQHDEFDMTINFGVKANF